MFLQYLTGKKPFFIDSKQKNLSLPFIFTIIRFTRD